MSKAAGTVKRYDIHMHSDDVQFLRECNDGDYMRFADYEALAAERDELRDELDLTKAGLEFAKDAAYRLSGVATEQYSKSDVEAICSIAIAAVNRQHNAQLTAAQQAAQAAMEYEARMRSALSLAIDFIREEGEMNSLSDEKWRALIVERLSAALSTHPSAREQGECK